MSRSACMSTPSRTALVAAPPDEESDGPWEFRSRGRQSVWTIESDRRHRVNAPLRLRVDA